MHTRGRFGVSRSTNELVAVAEDAFEDDVIAKELNMLNGNDTDDDEDAAMKLPGMAKHFLVFIATTLLKGKSNSLLLGMVGDHSPQAD